MLVIPLPSETRTNHGWTHKVVVQLADLQALGAATSGNINLFPMNSGLLSEGDQVCGVMVHLVTNLAGTSLSAATVKIGDGGSSTRYLAATATDLYTAAASNTKSTAASAVTYAFSGSDIANNYGYIVAGLATTGCNLSALTAGQFEVYLRISPIGGLTGITEAPGPYTAQPTE